MQRARTELRAGPARRARRNRDRNRARNVAILTHRRLPPLTARLLGDPPPGRSALDRLADREGSGSAQALRPIAVPVRADPPTAGEFFDDTDGIGDSWF